MSRIPFIWLFAICGFCHDEGRGVLEMMGESCIVLLMDDRCAFNLTKWNQVKKNPYMKVILYTGVSKVLGCGVSIRLKEGD